MRKNNIFWISYSDLMSSLFFVMLVLFVLAIGFLKIQMKENEILIEKLKQMGEGLKIENERLEKLLNLEKQFDPLLNDNSFHYLPECKKFVARDLMGIEIFYPNGTEIKPEFHERVLQVGRHIMNFVNILSQNDPYSSYLLIIEGNMANTYDQRINPNSSWGYKTSFERALAVHDFWLRHGINFRKNEKVEVLICGSGFSGLCRDPDEKNNKRFSIQIIPKVAR